MQAKTDSSQDAFYKLWQAFRDPRLIYFNGIETTNLLNYNQFYDLNRSLSKEHQEELIGLWEKEIRRASTPLWMTNGIIFACWLYLCWLMWSWIGSVYTRVVLSQYQEMFSGLALIVTLVSAHYLSKLTHSQSNRLRDMKKLRDKVRSSYSLKLALRRDKERRAEA